MLADFQIKAAVGREIFLSPYEPDLVQPASLDLRLGSQFMRYVESNDPVDPELPLDNNLSKIETQKFVIRPGEFVLATTLEWIGIGPTLAARVEGKSTIGRLGLTIHSTAGFIDPGFRGNITLEMKNDNVRPIILRAGMKIAQVSFFKMAAEPEKPYGHEDLGSHYQNQRGVTPAASIKANSLVS